MNSASIMVVRFLGVLVGLVLVADLFRSPFNWQMIALRLTISFPLLVPWSILKKKRSQALAYLLLWIDLFLSFGLVMGYFAFGRALGFDAFPRDAALAAVAVFSVCAPSILLMRRLYAADSRMPIKSIQHNAGSRPFSGDSPASATQSEPAPRG